MKNSLIFLLSFISLHTYAQYVPLVAEHKYWIYDTYDNNDIPHIISGYLITFQGDTLINNLLYKKVFQKDLSGTHPCPPIYQPCFAFDVPYQPTSQNLIGFIRENPVEQKVYFKPEIGLYCNVSEYLLFDFSLTVGSELDTCKKEALGGQAGFGRIDSISQGFYYGKMRKTLNTTGYITYLGLPPVGEVKLLEGLGFERFGLFHTSGNRNELHDFCEGNSPADCNILSRLHGAPDVPSLIISPNPAGNELYLNEWPEIKSAQAIHTDGRIQTLEFSDKRLDLSALSPGFYFLKISTAEGNILFARLVKK